MEALKSLIPDTARDVRVNLGALERIAGLTPRQLWGAMLACAFATKQPATIDGVRNAAAAHLDAAALAAAESAAAIMAMNNVYYRFVHLAGDAELAKLPAGLRMQVMGNPGVDAVDFELWCLAVSAINGCGRCIESHVAQLRKHGLSSEQIQQAARIAAVVNATAAAIEIGVRPSPAPRT